MKKSIFLYINSVEIYIFCIFVMLLSCKENATSPESPKATISGTFTLPFDACDQIWYLLIDDDLDGDNGSIYQGTGKCGEGKEISYEVSNVPAGTFYIYAIIYIIGKAEGPPVFGDYIGIYGGEITNPPNAPNAIIPSSGTVKIDINLDIYGNWSDSWYTASGMSTVRGSLGPHAAVVNEKIYVIGGFDGNDALASGEVYDPLTDSWNPINSMPVAISQHDLAVVKEKVYAIGGTTHFPDPISSVYEYDPVADSWEIKAEMPTPRRLLVLSVLNDKIYAIGGLDNSGIFLNTVERYDPSLNTWDSIENMTFRKSSMASSVVNGRIYVLGGFSYGIPQSDIEVYDPVDNNWFIVPDILTPRNLFTSCVYKGKIYAFGGGAVPDVGISNLVEEYDPDTDSVVEKAAMPFASAALTCATVENKIYVIGGRLADNSLCNTLQVYVPPQ